MRCARLRCCTKHVKHTQKRNPFFICSFFRSMSSLPAQNKEKQGSESTLQSLFDYSRLMFQQHKGKELSPKKVVDLNQRLCSVPLAELGLQAPVLDGPPVTMQTVAGRIKELEEVRKQPGYKANITYLHIFEDSEMSVGIFCMPAGAVIPLHDHPGMTVFSRVLYGQLFVQAFDWVEDRVTPAAQRRQKEQSALPPELQDSSSDMSEDDETGTRAARLVVAKVQSGDDTPMVLFPHSHGNIHSFTALTDCAVLDVLSPPYDSKYGRDCTYYYVESQLCKDKGQVLLAEYDPPDDFEVTRGVYRGVPLVTKDNKKRFNMKKLSDIADSWHV